MKRSEKYLLQSAGIYTFLAWIEQQKERGITCIFDTQTLYLPLTASKYFSLGVSKFKKHKFPFLCIQPNENAWMRNVEWDYAAIRENDPHLYLVSKYVEGDGFKYADLLPFSIAIEFDMLEKLNLIKDFDKLDGREYFVDTDGTLRVNYHKKVFSIELRKISEKQDIMGDMTEYLLAEEEKRAEQIDALTSKYGSVVPIPLQK